MLYYLIFLVIWAIVLSYLNFLNFNFLDISLETIYLLVVCWLVNKLFSKFFKVSINPESSLISALILSLIIGPGRVGTNFLLLTLAAVFAMASKYLIIWKSKHIFNPAAFGAVAAAIVLGQGASWWVGTAVMLPAVFFGGLLVLKKLRRYELVGTFLFVYLIFSLSNIPNLIISSPIIFFSLVMLVEPLTSPTIKSLQIVYALVVIGANFLYQRFLPNVYYTLELSLLTGNIFAFIFSGNFRQVLKLKDKKQLTSNVIAFVFEPWKKLNFRAGQFLEWTFSHPNPDSRGIRRYFTIASSPTEDFIMLASKFYEKPSTFKTNLKKMRRGGEIIVSNLDGEFTLPEDLSKKLVFIAGGIGITPFRSMVKFLIDTSEQMDIVLLFSNKTSEDIVFKDIFDSAKDLGVRTVYINTDKMGLIDEAMIKKEVSDWKERIFYISGPESLVLAFEKILSKMGVLKRQVKTDYFPGYE